MKEFFIIPSDKGDAVVFTKEGSPNRIRATPNMAIRDHDKEKLLSLYLNQYLIGEYNKLSWAKRLITAKPSLASIKKTLIDWEDPKEWIG
jgi:hypothetical protein